MDLPALRPNIAGLTSPVQQAEMAVLLAGRWPPLKPLPIFKFESDEYRATVEFDKMRGEWVCRKTSLSSNKVKELRGGLTEITMALPPGRGQFSADSGAAERQEQESEKEAGRRLQAILEWRELRKRRALFCPAAISFQAPARRNRRQHPIDSHCSPTSVQSEECCRCF